MHGCYLLFIYLFIALFGCKVKRQRSFALDFEWAIDRRDGKTLALQVYPCTARGLKSPGSDYLPQSSSNNNDAAWKLQTSMKPNKSNYEQSAQFHTAKQSNDANK